PSNIMLVPSETPEGHAVILDFGIAKCLSDSGSKKKLELTKAGEIFGSPFYMSPEQCQGFEIDARSDIYSMGCMLYQSLSGQIPLQGDSLYPTLTLQVHHIPPPFKDLGINVSPQLEEIVFHAIQKAPEDRYQTVKEMQADLLKLNDHH